MQTDEILLSVVTVVFNGENLIEDTIKSVESQNFDAMEYLVIDGKSSDNTIGIVNKYPSVVSKIISEPDKGIYDAMNKALKIARGKFVLFLNCGDLFASSTVLHDIFTNADALKSDVIYGDTLIINQSGQIVHNRRHRPPLKLNWKSFKNGMTVCHQSFIARRALCEPYNLDFKYSADFDWCLNILKKSTVTFNFNNPISKFLEGGRTRKTIIPGLKERFKIMRKFYGLHSALCHNIILGVKFSFFVVFHRWF